MNIFHTVVNNAHLVLSNPDRRRIYSLAYRFLRHPLEEDPFMCDSNNIKYALVYHNQDEEHESTEDENNNIFDHENDRHSSHGPRHRNRAADHQTGGRQRAADNTHHQPGAETEEDFARVRRENVRSGRSLFQCCYSSFENSRMNYFCLDKFRVGHLFSYSGNGDNWLILLQQRKNQQLESI